MALPPPASDQTVLVTGASSGLGAELARELVRRGYAVTLVARRQDRLRRLADELAADVEAADLADAGERSELVARMRERDVVGVCNNAGFGTTGAFAEQDLAREQELLRVNVEAVHHLTLEFGRAMAAVGSGAILNVASTAAFQPMPRFATYAASKAFVLSFSEAVHAELSMSGVSVTALCPGPTRTEFGERAGAGEAWRRLPDVVFAEPRDVAREGVDAMIHGRRTAVPGLGNKVSSLYGRFAPRSLLLPIVARLTPPEIR